MLRFCCYTHRGICSTATLRPELPKNIRVIRVIRGQIKNCPKEEYFCAFVFLSFASAAFALRLLRIDGHQLRERNWKVRHHEQR
jgi:hypothetical protein